jgi:multicomponent Na+:H+ antiporter subunit G
MIDLLIMALSLLGAIFVLLAAIGIVRMPDLYLRISVTTKAATLGIGLILICAAIHFNSLAMTSRVVAIVFFLLLTAPVGAHLIGRASYFVEVPLWKKSVTDDLEGKYHKRSHTLTSEPINPEKSAEKQPSDQG